MTILEAKRETRLAVWQQHIQDQRSSGLTVRAWCAQNGCSEKCHWGFQPPAAQGDQGQIGVSHG